MQIVILSSNQQLYSTRRLYAAAIERGHVVEVVDPANCYVDIGSGEYSIHASGQPLEGVDAIIPRISIPLTFYGAAVIRQFEMMRVFTTCGSQALVRCRDKLRSLQILARAGIGMPKTAFAFKPLDVDDLIRKIGGPPFVIKLIEGSQGIGVLLAETRSAARSVIEAFHNLRAKILVQEFIKESSGTDLRAFVVAGKVVAAMRRHGHDGDFRANLHRGGSASLVELSEEESSLAIAAAEALGLTVCGVDLLQSDRGPLVIELNASPGLEGIEAVTKVDVAGKIVEFIELGLSNGNSCDIVGA